MTGLELQTRTLERLGEDPAAPVYYTGAEVMSRLNWAHRLFVLRTRCLETTVPFSMSGTSFVRMLTVFPDWLVPLRVRINGGAKLKPSRLADFAALDGSWTLNRGPAKRYAHLGFDLFAIYPRPNTVLLEITYARCPVDLTVDNEPEIPEEYHPDLIKGAISLLRVKEGQQEWQKTLDGWQEFLNGVQVLAGQVRSRNIEQGYDLMPIEKKLFDRSHTLKPRS